MRASASASASHRERPEAADVLDVIVVGAGISGIGAGCRLTMACPDKRFAIFEARDVIGGTWDLFRYPGIRSDSDMFTLSYPFHPWTAPKAIADGSSILSYIKDTAARFGVDDKIRFRHRVVSAAWSSAERLWTVDVEVGEERAPRRYRSRFVYLCSGYYSYDSAHTPSFPGAARFTGRVIHPQWWPDDLDYSDKRIVVIGSGATAVTLVPALAERAAHVTMLQRSPSYVFALPTADRIADWLRARVPAAVAHNVVRWKNVLFGIAFFQFCRRYPERAARFLRRQIEGQLPAGYPVDPNFVPRYKPWDQRLCVIPENDLLAALSSGKAEIVTDTIDTFTEKGVRTTSGRELTADIIVTATGLKLLPVGGIKLSVDGKDILPSEMLVYKGLMLSGVPNLAWCVGYTNASWTLRADLASRYVCRLLRYMDRHRFDQATPTPDAGTERSPLLDLTSGYITREAEHLPKQGKQSPWRLRQNYVLDYLTMQLGRVADPAMAFSSSGRGR